MKDKCWIRILWCFAGWQKLLISGSLSVLAYYLVNFHGVPGLPQSEALGKIGILDMDYGYSPEAAYQKLTAFGEQGRYAYKHFILWIDFLFPAIISFFFASIMTTIVRKYLGDKPQMLVLAVIPLCMMVADWLENISILIMLESYPFFYPVIARVAMTFTLVKAFCGILSLLILIFLLIIILWNSLRRKES